MVGPQHLYSSNVADQVTAVCPKLRRHSDSTGRMAPVEIARGQIRTDDVYSPRKKPRRLSRKVKIISIPQRPWVMLTSPS